MKIRKKHIKIYKLIYNKTIKYIIIIINYKKKRKKYNKYK